MDTVRDFRVRPQLGPPSKVTSMAGTAQVWLPSLRVWARAPQAAVSSSSSGGIILCAVDSSPEVSTSNKRRKQSAAGNTCHSDVIDLTQKDPIEEETAVQCPICESGTLCCCHLICWKLILAHLGPPSTFCHAVQVWQKT